MTTYNVLNDFDPDQFNLLIPVQSLQDINPIFKYVTNKVQISTDLPDKEIYQEKSAGQNMYALTHRALMKLCNAGNGQIVEIKKIQPRVCEKCIEIAKATRIAVKCGSCESRYNVAVQVIMKFPELSGGWKIVQASREIDVSMITKSGQADKVKEFATEHAESKAISRCIRKAFSIKSAYTLQELEKPFIAVYPVLDAKDPDVKKALIAGSMAASNLLYGSGLQIGDGGKLQALPEAKAADEDYEVEPMGGEQQVETEEPETPPVQPDKQCCSSCSTEIAANVAKFSQEKYGKELCYNCQQVEKKKKGAGK
ncbi:MAG TPA: hypothetical protein VN549_03680 [Negativicutes bacterium]|nr:hypothetical protein [Negativicutes bacterium]